MCSKVFVFTLDSGNSSSATEQSIIQLTQLIFSVILMKLATLDDSTRFVVLVAKV